MPSVLNLKKSNCKNCHRCIRKCPVKSIRFSGHQAHIISDQCILCGQCFVVCPQEAKEIVDDRGTVRALIDSGAPVIASVSPSFFAVWDNCGINSMRKALKALGFADAEETAIGATIVKREYERLIREGTQDIIISSACHSVNLLVEKHFPELRKFLAPTVSPMVAHAMDIKRRIPEAKVVFIGPCVAKKDEYAGTCVDAVLTFEEFDQMCHSKGIEVEPEFGESFKGRATGFSVAGGITNSMDLPDTGYFTITVDGTKNCLNALRDIRSGKIDKCFIEMYACAGGCIDGPIMEKYINSPVRHICSVLKHVGKEDFLVEQPSPESLHKDHIGTPLNLPTPSDKEIREILARIGKPNPSDELNCGSCGYDSCRDKAIAIYRGTADYSMCLPFIMDRSERINNKVLNNMPSGLIVVNEDLEVQQINRSALALLNISHESDILGDCVVRILDTAPFFTVLETGKSVKKLRSYFSDYGRYFEQTIVHDRSSRILIDIFSDVTEEEEEAARSKAISRQTAEITNNVIENQMRIVQEIASLLGETTAETKIALTRLKESLSLNDDEEE